MELEFTNIDISKFLPHRAPMLMVDMIHKLSDNEVVTSFLIKKENIFVKNNTFLEAGLVENAAQTCSSIVGKDFFLDDNFETKEDVKVIGFISAIKKVAIYKCPNVNQEIQTIANLVSRFDSDEYSICTISCNSYCKEEKLLEAELNLFVQEIKS